TRGGGALPEIAAEAPKGALDAPPSGFAWRTIPGGDAYRVRLFHDDGRLVWTSAEVAAPPLAWPAEAATPPGAYYWKVEALAAGRPIAESRLVDFTLTPASKR